MHFRSVPDQAMQLEPAYAKLAERLRMAFRRCPSLSLTVFQTADWLELDDALSNRVLEALASEGVIERGDDDRYRLLLKH